MSEDNEQEFCSPPPGMVGRGHLKVKPRVTGTHGLTSEDGRRLTDGMGRLVELSRHEAETFKRVCISCCHKGASGCFFGAFPHGCVTFRLSVRKS
jgi:hypothetical protein